MGAAAGKAAQSEQAAARAERAIPPVPTENPAAGALQGVPVPGVKPRTDPVATAGKAAPKPAERTTGWPDKAATHY